MGKDNAVYRWRNGLIGMCRMYKSYFTKEPERWNKQRIRVVKLHEKVANQRKNFLHHKSKELATHFDFVVIDDLHMKGMSRALRFGKSVTDNGWGMLTIFLAYKIEKQGKQLVKIDKWFPSTKMCSRCGNRKNIII